MNMNQIIAVVLFGIAATGLAFVASVVPGPITQVEYVIPQQLFIEPLW